MSIPRTGAKHQATTDQRLFKSSYNVGAIENINRTGRTRHRLATGKVLRINQHQTAKAHVFHGPRRAADVAGMAGIDQNDTNIRQQWERSQTGKGSKSYLSPSP